MYFLPRLKAAAEIGRVDKLEKLFPLSWFATADPFGTGNFLPFFPPEGSGENILTTKRKFHASTHTLEKSQTICGWGNVSIYSSRD